MAYIESHAPTMHTKGIPDRPGSAERQPEWVSPLNRKPTSKVTDEAILQTIGHLNDQQLDDIGICRKPRRPSWQSLGRGISPMEIIEFDYFWLDV